MGGVKTVGPQRRFGPRACPYLKGGVRAGKERGRRGEESHRH